MKFTDFSVDTRKGSGGKEDSLYITRIVMLPRDQVLQLSRWIQAKDFADGYSKNYGNDYL